MSLIRNQPGGMKRFEGKGIAECHKIVEAEMNKNPERFGNLQIDWILFLIAKKEYFAPLMGKEIISSEENKHVWNTVASQSERCAGCCWFVSHEDLNCNKCGTNAHPGCVKLVRPCDCKYYDNKDTNSILLHTFSRITTSGDCDHCDQPITTYRKGQYCKWCKMKTHIACTQYKMPCVSARYRKYLLPPFWHEARGCGTPLLVFINPRAGDGYGEILMNQFLDNLQPAQVVDVRVLDPAVAFLRYAPIKNFIVMIIGGDMMYGYILKAFNTVRHKLSGEAVFRFIPIGPYAEIGHSFGGRIRYSKKTATYLIQQLSRLRQFSFTPWNVYEINHFRPTEALINEDFYFIFCFGMETYYDPDVKKTDPWTEAALQAVKLVPNRLLLWCGMPEVTSPTDEDPKPKIVEYIVLKMDDQLVNLIKEPYTAVVLMNRIRREDDFSGSLEQIQDDCKTLDVYGLTKYCKLTRRNIERFGTKLGESRNINVQIIKNMPYQADAFSYTASQIAPGEMRDVYVREGEPISVLAVSSYRYSDLLRTSIGRREKDGKPLDLNEYYITELKKRVDEYLEQTGEKWIEETTLSEFVQDVLRRYELDVRFTEGLQPLEEDDETPVNESLKEKSGMEVQALDLIDFDENVQKVTGLIKDVLENVEDKEQRDALITDTMETMMEEIREKTVGGETYKDWDTTRLKIGGELKTEDETFPDEGIARERKEAEVKGEKYLEPKMMEEGRAEEEREARERKRAEEEKEARERKRAEEEKEARERKRAEEEREARERKRAEEEKEARERKRAEEEREARERKRAEEEREARERKRAEEEKEARERKRAQEEWEALQRKRAEEEKEARERKIAEEAEVARKKALEQKLAEEAKLRKDEQEAGPSKRKEDDSGLGKDQKKDSDKVEEAKKDKSEKKAKDKKKKKQAVCI